MPSRLQARYHVARASYAGAGTGPEAGAIGRQRPGRGGGNGGQSRTSALVVFVAAPFGLAMRSCRHSFPDDPFEPLACGQSLFSSCKPITSRLNQRLLRLRLMPIACGKKSCIPTPLESGVTSVEGSVIGNSCRVVAVPSTLQSTPALICPAIQPARSAPPSEGEYQTVSSRLNLTGISS